MKYNHSFLQRAAELVLLAAFVFMPSQAFYMAAPYSMEGGKMVVQASIGGHVGKFLLDTGAPCTLTAAFAERAGIQGGQTMRFSDSNGQPVTVRVTMLDRLVLGGFSFMQLQAVVLEAGNIVEQMGADGIIGYNLMRQGIVKFDSRRHLFILTDQRDSLALDYNYCSEMLPDSYVPLFPVRVGTQVDTVMFDSGAESLYEMSAGTYERMKGDTASLCLLAEGRGVLSAGAAGTESSSQKWRLLIPTFHVGAATFSRATTITTDAPDSRIGTPLLRYGDVVLDFTDGFFYFIPCDRTIVPDVYEPEWNVVVTVQEGHLVAGMVWNAEESGIQSGDPIVSIRGQRVGEVELQAALTQNLFNLDPSGTPATYLNRRTGKECDIVLRMQ